MCGRYKRRSNTADFERVLHHKLTGSTYRLESPGEALPLSEQPVINSHGLVMVRKFGATLPNSKYPLYNARVETYLSKPFWSHMLRVVVPADSFYEKDARFLSTEPLLFAGICDLNAFFILTKDANEIVKPFHHRMPVILRSEIAFDWMNGNVVYQNPVTLQEVNQ